MNDSRKGPDGVLKRNLLATLVREVHRWDGQNRLCVKEAARLTELMGLLERCPLYLAERNWLTVSRLWLSQASEIPEPDAWLREVWLSGLSLWLLYLDRFPLGADAPPAPPPNLPYRPERPRPARAKPATAPGRPPLPFGFVKPLI